MPGDARRSDYNGLTDTDGATKDRSNDLLNYAASVWQKFDPNPVHMGNIQEGEWCLWSMVIGGERNYFSGSWFMRERVAPKQKEPWLSWQGGPSYPVNDTVYWARVNHVEI